MTAPKDIHGFWQDNPKTNGFKEGEAWLRNNPNTATAGFNDAMAYVADLLCMPGEMREHLHMYRGESQRKIARLAESMRTNGFDPNEPIFVVVKQNGKATIFEGNHRTRAAVDAGITRVPVTVRYHGGSENIIGVWTPTSKGKEE